MKSSDLRQLLSIKNLFLNGQPMCFERKQGLRSKFKVLFMYLAPPLYFHF